MKTLEQVLAGIEWKAEQEGSSSLGTIQDVFPNAELLIIKNSKTGAKRATIMIKQNGKVTNVVCAENITPLVREGIITEKHLAGFPVMYSEKYNSLFVGAPSGGWQEIKNIVVEAFTQAIDYSKLANASI